MHSKISFPIFEILFWKDFLVFKVTLYRNGTHFWIGKSVVYLQLIICSFFTSIQYKTICDTLRKFGVMHFKSQDCVYDKEKVLKFLSVTDWKIS